MAQPTLDATPGGASANSYCTRQEADDYHDTHLWSDTWKAAEAWKKEVALIQATRMLDQEVEWDGSKSDSTQPLRWPRQDVLDPEGELLANDEIPVFLRNATAELARWLLAEDRTAERGYGLSSLKADVVELVFDSQDERPVLPAAVQAMVLPYGNAGGTNSGYVKVVRV